MLHNSDNNNHLKSKTATIIVYIIQIISPTINIYSGYKNSNDDETINNILGETTGTTQQRE